MKQFFRDGFQYLASLNDKYSYKINDIAMLKRAEMKIELKYWISLITLQFAVGHYMLPLKNNSENYMLLCIRRST